MGGNSKSWLCPEVAKMNLRIWFRRIQKVPIPALSLIPTGFSVADVDVTMSDEQQIHLYTPRQATIYKDPCNTDVPQHHLWAAVPSQTLPANSTEMAVARWDAPHPDSLPSFCLSSATTPGISEGMAEDSSNTCTKSSPSGISLACPAWLGRGGCLMRLHTQFTCGQIYKHMGQNKLLRAALTAL